MTVLPMDQVTPEPPPAACPTCEQVATAISSLMSQKPDNFVFAPNELLSGQILYDRVDDVNTYDFDAGLDYSESSTCTTCKALVQRITDTKLWKEDPEPISTLASLKITLSGPMCQRDCFMLDIHSATKRFQLRIVPSIFAKRSSPPASLVDFSIVRSWVQTCDTQHAGKCHSYSTERLYCQVDMRMIDVIGCCVVRMRNGERMPKYAALSYVWGRVSTLLCTKGNKHDLETPGSLDRVPYCDNLARTIKDAMKLTESLGLRYLWADMICIVQDDPYDKLVQLPNMANIYGDAYFTIVAADGTDSQSGIGGISDDRALTVPTLLSFGALSSAMTFAVKPDAEESREKIWHTRGWTMQERALSRRTLMFLDQTVSWACMQASFDEETYLPDPSDEEKNCYYCQASRASDQTTLTAAKWPDYDNYARLVSLFTERQLTCADDILNAFTGIMAALQPSFPHGFLQGLPEFFFDIAVLWRRTASNFGHLPFWPTRRCVKPGKIWASEYFASWSWAGWEGCRAQWYPIYNDAVDYDMEVITTTPSVVWQKLDKPDNASEIRNDFFRYRKSSQNTQNESEGWETVHEETQSPSSAAMAVRFTHPEAPGQKFYYPLPIAKRTVQQPNINPGTVHLTFRGAVCRFTFRKEAFKSTYPQGSLHSADETWVGFMHDILIPVSREDTDLLACEVVCLSEGYVNVNREYLVERWELEWVEDAVPEVAHFPQIRQAGYVYHFYNVMWLAWEDGIAYRRGLGRIWKPMWEKQELNEMEIVLG